MCPPAGIQLHESYPVSSSRCVITHFTQSPPSTPHRTHVVPLSRPTRSAIPPPLPPSVSVRSARGTSAASPTLIPTHASSYCSPTAAATKESTAAASAPSPPSSSTPTRSPRPRESVISTNTARLWLIAPSRYVSHNPRLGLPQKYAPRIHPQTTRSMSRPAGVHSPDHARIIG